MSGPVPCSLLLLLHLLLLVSPALPDSDCSCWQCEPSLEVYRGTDLLLTTSSTITNISISTTSRGADMLYLRGCGSDWSTPDQRSSPRLRFSADIKKQLKQEMTSVGGFSSLQLFLCGVRAPCNRFFPFLDTGKSEKCIK